MYVLMHPKLAAYISAVMCLGVRSVSLHDCSLRCWHHNSMMFITPTAQLFGDLVAIFCEYGDI